MGGIRPEQRASSRRDRSGERDAGRLAREARAHEAWRHEREPDERGDVSVGHLLPGGDLQDLRGSTGGEVLKPGMAARDRLQQRGVRRPCDLATGHDDLHLGRATLKGGQHRDTDDVGSAQICGTGLTGKHVQMQADNELGLVEADLTHSREQRFPAVDRRPL